MEERMREESRLRPSDGPEDDSPDPAVAALREEGRRLLRAGRDAIDRALSGDSESFLRASVQRGGE